MTKYLIEPTKTSCDCRQIDARIRQIKLPQLRMLAHAAEPIQQLVRGNFREFVSRNAERLERERHAEVTLEALEEPVGEERENKERHA